MRVVIAKDYDEMSEYAAKEVISIMEQKKNAILGLATGSTPIGLYEKLVEAHKQGLDFSEIISFNLDEYVGIRPENEKSYHYFMQEHLFQHVNMQEKNIHLPCSKKKMVEKAAKDYDEMLMEQGPVDIQILGIGNNGHIAFNEPAKELNIGTSIVQLAESTIQANARFFEDEEEVPQHAISMGMGSIFQAKKIIILASGKQKHDAVRYVIDKKGITTSIPASLLHLHSDVTFIIDKECYEG